VEEARQHSAVTDLIFPMLAAIIGAVFAVHCPRAALRELRSGVTKGRVNQFRRDTAPISFWLSIVATFFAGVLGVLFVILGLAMIGSHLELIG
jgi:hypothetical protein